MYEECMDDVWMMYEECRGNVWMMYQGCMDERTEKGFNNLGKLEIGSLGSHQASSFDQQQVKRRLTQPSDRCDGKRARCFLQTALAPCVRCVIGLQLEIIE
jgi:hypothetical protein